MARAIRHQYKPIPPADYLHSRLHYDSETGIFRFKPFLFPNRCEKGFNTRWSFRIAGTPNHGNYVTISLHKNDYQAHRLAWAMVYEDPGDSLVFHVCGYSNAIDNLCLLRTS